MRRCDVRDSAHLVYLGWGGECFGGGVFIGRRRREFDSVDVWMTNSGSDGGNLVLRDLLRW